MDNLYSWFLNKVRQGWTFSRAYVAGVVRWSAYPITQVYNSAVAAFAGDAMGAAMQDNDSSTLGDLVGSANPFVPSVGQILTPRQAFDMFPVSVAAPYQGEAIISYQTEFSDQWNTFREIVSDDDILTRIQTDLQNVVIKQYLLTGSGRPRLVSWIIVGRVQQFQTR